MVLITLLIVGTFIALGLFAGSLSTARPVRRRLARLVDGSVAQIHDAEEGVLSTDSNSTLARLLRPLAGKAGSGETDSLKPIRERLIHAGYRRENGLTIYMGSRVALALLLPVLVLVWPGTWALEQVRVLALMLLAAGIGYVAPSYWITRLTAHRQQKLTRALPDALDLMVVCVEAGLGINASLARVAKEFATTSPVLAAEFEMATLEVRAGKSTSNALRSLADRTGVSDMSSLVAMLVQTERFGTSLADTLRIHADAMRTQRLQRAEEDAAKAPLRMMFPMVFIFVATLIVTIGPGLITLTGFFEESN